MVIITQLCECTKNLCVLHFKKGECYDVWLIPQEEERKEGRELGNSTTTVDSNGRRGGGSRRKCVVIILIVAAYVHTLSNHSSLMS